MIASLLPHLNFACTVPGGSFFGLPHWWQFVGGTTDALGECSPDFTFPNDIWPVAVAAVDMLLWLAGVIAVISVLISGINFMTSAGNSEHAASARRRLVNSLLGLLIALIAIAFVTFVGNSLK